MGSQSAASRPAIIRVRFNDGSAARTNGKDIWVDDRLNDIQLKCAIMHERVHIERGHGTHQVEAVETAVRYETARRLLPEMSGGCGGDSIKTAAINRGVTRQVLMDRAATLNDVEAATAGCLSCRLCPAIEYRFAALAAA